VEGSYELAWKALALHPLVPGVEIARQILDEYREQHGVLFPALE
jgi:alpha-galactosidase/6-phospho-beta-glucosidase family protein